MNNLNLQRNSAFIFILFLGFIYSLFLVIAFKKIFPGFLMQFIFLIEVLNHHQSILNLVFSQSFLINLSSGLILVYLLWRLIKSSFLSTNKLFKTKKFIRSLSFKKEKPIAFTSGFFHPQIYISEKLTKSLSSQEYAAVLLHEQMHQKNYDPLKDFIIDLIKNILPKFPGKVWLFGNYSALVETNCDQHAEINLGNKLPLVSALLKINQNQFDFYINSFSSFHQRISILVGQKKPTFKKFFALNSFLLVIFLLATTFINRSTIFYQCSHLVQCIEVLVAPKNIPIIDHCKN